MKKKILCLFLVLSVFHSALWAFAYDGSGQVSTYPGGSGQDTTQTGGGPSGGPDTKLINDQIDCKEDLTELNGEIADIENELPDNSSVDNINTEIDSAGDSQDNSIENNIDPVIEENQAVVEQSEAESQSETAGDPVRVATGEYIQTDTDIEMKKGFSLERIYRLNNNTTGLFGFGWSSTLDERIMHCKEPGIEELYRKQNLKTNNLASKVNTLEKSIKTTFHVSNIETAGIEFSSKVSRIVPLLSKAQELQTRAINLFGSTSPEANLAQEQYNKVYSLYSHSVIQLVKLNSYLSVYNSYTEKLNSERTLTDELRVLYYESNSIQNPYSFYEGTPASWLNCGLGNLILIDKESTPHIFQKDYSEWKNGNENSSLFEKIIFTNSGEYELSYSDGTIKFFTSEGLIKKIINPQGDFIEIVRDEALKIKSINTSFNEKYFIFYSQDQGQKTFISSIENSRDSSDKISFSYKNGFLSSVTDSSLDTVQFLYDSNNRISQIKKCDNSRIQINSFWDNFLNRFCVSETINEENHSEFFKYDISDRKTIHIDYAGNESIFYFDKQLRTIGKTDSSGNAMEYQYDKNGNLISQIVNGNKTDFEFDSQNNLTKAIYSDGTCENYFYDEFSNLIYYTDRDGFSKKTKKLENDFNLTYDNYGNIISAESSEHKVNFTYDNRNRITSCIFDGVTNFSVSYTGKTQTTKYHSGLIISHTYNGRKDLVEIKEEDTTLGNTAIFHFEYDKCHHPTKKSIQTKDGEITLWEKSWTPDGFVKTSKEFDQWDKWITEYSYKNGRLTSKTKWKESAPENKVVTEIYEKLSYGNFVTRQFTDGNGNISTYQYTSDGFLSSYINGEGETFDFYFSPAGRLLQNTGRYGNQINYEYDSNGDLIEEKTSSRSNDFYKYDYDAYGRIIKSTDPEGNTKTCRYNALGFIDCVSDGYGNLTYIKYNAKNQIAEKIFPDGSKVSYDYDVNQRLTKIQDDLGVLWEGEYDKAGNLIHEKGRALVEKNYSYDKTGRITNVIADGNILESYIYSDYGKKICFTDGEGNNFFQYLNDDGTLKSETNRLNETKDYTSKSDSDNIQITWNETGHITSAKNESCCFEYTYNEDGLLESFTDISAMETVSYEYDSAGRKTRVLSSNRDINYKYGANNEVLEIWDNLSRLSVRFFYDEMMREIRREYGNKTSIEFYYDKTGRVIAITEKDLAGKIINGEGYLYGDGGRRTATVNSKGEVTFYKYNNLGQIESVKYPAVPEHTEQLKSKGRNLGLDETPVTAENFLIPYETYLELQSLLENYIPGFNLLQDQKVYSESFTYDKNGNRKSYSLPFGTLEYLYDKENKLQEICFLESSVVKYQYDLNGNLINKISIRSNEKYFYSADNRLTDYSRTENGIETTCHYTYDVFGRRLLTVRNGKAAHRCLYDGFTFDLIKEGPVFQNGIFTDYLKSDFYMTEERVSDDRYIFTFDSPENDFYFEESFPVSFNGKIFGRKIGNRTEYFGTEILGSVTSVTDHYGNLEKSFDYDIFGNPVSTDIPAYGYTGKPYDFMTGFYNYGFRDYSPATSRFTSSDPIRDGMNWYQYCAADPVNYVDLWGLDRLRMTFVKGSNTLQIVQFPVNEYGNVIPDQVKNVGTFEVSNNVRNELNGLRNAPDAKTTPVSGTPENYFPRDFPEGTWEVGAPRGSTNSEVNGLFIPTNAVQEVPVYGTDLANAPKDENGNYISTGTQLDTAYGLHATNESSYTQGCIRLKNKEESNKIVNIINEVLATKDGEVTLLVMDFEYPSENK